MLYPSDAKRRREHHNVILANTVYQAPESNPQITLIPRNHRELIHMPSLEEILTRESEAGRRGSVAGDILLFLLEMVETGVKEPSLRKAIFLAEDYHKSTRFGDGSKAGSSDRVLRKYWREYQPVAHFWAAYRMCQFSSDQNLWDAKTQVFGPGFRIFLALSKHLLKMGRAFKPSRFKEPVPFFQLSKVWRIPPNFPLPTVSPTIPDLPNWMSVRLKTYKRNYNPYG